MSFSSGSLVDGRSMVCVQPICRHMGITVRIWGTTPIVLHSYQYWPHVITIYGYGEENEHSEVLQAGGAAATEEPPRQDLYLPLYGAALCYPRKLKLQTYTSAHMVLGKVIEYSSGIYNCLQMRHELYI